MAHNSNSYVVPWLPNSQTEMFSVYAGNARSLCLVVGAVANCSTHAGLPHWSFDRRNCSVSVGRSISWRQLNAEDGDLYILFKLSTMGSQAELIAATKIGLWFARDKWRYRNVFWLIDWLIGIGMHCLTMIIWHPVWQFGTRCLIHCAIQPSSLNVLGGTLKCIFFPDIRGMSALDVSPFHWYALYKSTFTTCLLMLFRHHPFRHQLNTFPFQQSFCC